MEIKYNKDNDKKILPISENNEDFNNDNEIIYDENGNPIKVKRPLEYFTE